MRKILYREFDKDRLREEEIGLEHSNYIIICDYNADFLLPDRFVNKHKVYSCVKYIFNIKAWGTEGYK